MAHEAGWACAGLCFCPYKDISVCRPSVDLKVLCSNLRGSLLWAQLLQAARGGCSSSLGLLGKVGFGSCQILPMSVGFVLELSGDRTGYLTLPCQQCVLLGEYWAHLAF